MSELEKLFDAVRAEAERETFPLDKAVYNAANKDALAPILYGGTLNSQLCFFGRDLGRDEVYAGQPLIGAAGTLVREGFFRAWQGIRPESASELQSICQRVLLSNTVPYKPPGNKAYSVKVKERFRPFIEELLVCHWQGRQIITLGTEAFKWYSPYASKGVLENFFRGSNRFDSSLDVLISTVNVSGDRQEKIVKLMPLPHPSPLNKRYYAKFPDMLQKRLEQIAF